MSEEQKQEQQSEQNTLCEQLHLINDDAELQDGIDQFIIDKKLSEYKKHYNIVSVIGSQSSGKSTLLNQVFGTEFQVMDRKKARTQTTKGIYAARDKEAPLIVLDIEGTDSVQRWDDRQFYSKSTGIFALALSQVLVINIWTNMVGNYEGSQLGIIKSIFEMNIKLFSVDQTKNIVFILRDFHESENFDHIKESIQSSLDKIWSEISKPANLQAQSPNELFHIEYMPMPSLIYQKNEFEEEAKKLRDRFTNPENEQYYFKDFEYEKNLPIEALSDFIKNIWGTIKENKDINLPNEKEIVAQIRCEAIKKEALQLVEPIIQKLQESIKEKPSMTFKETACEALETALNYFNKNADYLPKIVEEKKDELEKEIKNQLYSLYIIQMSQVKNQLVHELDDKLQRIPNFGTEKTLEYLYQIKVSAQEQIKTYIENSVIQKGEWDSIKQFKDFQLTIDQTLEGKMTQVIHKELNTELENSIVSRLSGFDLNFWELLQQDYEKLETQIQERYVPLMKFNQAKQRNKISQINNELYDILNQKLSEKLRHTTDYMNKKFNKLFKYTENGIIENWKGKEDSYIENKFTDSKQKIFKILENLKFNKIQKQEFVETFQNSLITDSNKSQKVEEESAQDKRVLLEVEIIKIKEDFNAYCDEQLQSAMRLKNQTDLLGIPKFFWAILIFFAYDDIFRMLSNPFLLTPLLIIMGGVGIAFATGNQKMLMLAVTQAYKIANEKVKQVVNQ